MGRNTAMVMVAAILGITAITIACIAAGVDTSVATAAIGTLGTVLGVGGGIIIGRKTRG